MYTIGLVGPIGSGCSYIADIIKDKKGYEIISLSNILRELYKKEHPGISDIERKKLQIFGDDLRKNYGSHYLAQLAINKTVDDNKNYIFDSIRNPGEVKYFKKHLSQFFLFGIFAEKDIRWERVLNNYNNDKRDFDEDDTRDSDSGYIYGQRVTDTFKMSDIIILNNNKLIKNSEKENNFILKIYNYINLIEGKTHFSPNNNETNMTIAYAESMRSSCEKRKVGAIIIDETGSIISSGYNEVPNIDATCKSEYGKCYRDLLKDKFKEELTVIVGNNKKEEEIFKLFKENFKILDYCRSAHAEENAILNIARNGVAVSLKTTTLYTTTYPCNLCATKIVNVGIKKLVYLEPYPVEEAKETLQQGKVKQEPFEGVTYNGYFRLKENEEL